MTSHRIALLGVDQTLLFNQQDMNDALIDTLVEPEIAEDKSSMTPFQIKPKLPGEL